MSEPSDADEDREELAMLRRLGRCMQGPPAGQTQARDDLAVAFLELLHDPRTADDLAPLAVRLANTALLAGWNPPEGKTVRQWGSCDMGDDPNERHASQRALTGEEEAREDAASWATGRPVYRDVTYGPWRFAN